MTAEGVPATPCRAKFGFTRGDVVGWSQFDRELPQGDAQGIVTGFDDERVAVSCRSGMFRLQPKDLYIVGEEKFHFRTGDTVTWNGADADVPHGTPGIVMGFTDMRVVVCFRGRLFQFRRDELSAMHLEDDDDCSPPRASGGYLKAAGVGLSDKDYMQYSVKTPQRSVSGSTVAPSSRDSASFGLGRRQSLDSRFPNTPEGFGSSERGGSSSVGDLDRHEDADAVELMPILKASPPMPVGSITGRYRVTLVRASMRQPFGVTLQAVELLGRTEAINVMEDLPHMGIRRSDELISVNGRKPETIRECNDLLTRAMSVTLVLQHWEPGKYSARRLGSGVESPEPPLVQRSFWCDEPSREEQSPEPAQPLRTLLATARPATSDENDGTFHTRIQRTSLKQLFGISLTAEQPKEKGQRASIVVAETLPHMGLMQGDQLLLINGVKPVSGLECCRIMERCMTIRLNLRRLQYSSNGTPIRHARLDLDILPIDDIVGHEEVETAEVDVSSSMPCTFMSGWAKAL